MLLKNYIHRGTSSNSLLVDNALARLKDINIIAEVSCYYATIIEKSV